MDSVITSTLASVVEQCAISSIRSTLAALDAFVGDSKTRISLRLARVESFIIALTRLPPGDVATLMMTMSATQLKSNLTTIAKFISRDAATQRAILLGLPNDLVSLLGSLNLTVPPLSSSSAVSTYVCSKVDAFLRPQLTVISDDLENIRIWRDQRLQIIDQALQQLETILTKTRELK